MRMLVLALVPVIVACGKSHGGPPADATQPDVDAAADAHVTPDGNPLDSLFGTGLCVDRACTQITAGIATYTPQFPLWADAASKLRWMYLPPGTQIDTSDMDHWVFPVGTKFWKEFTSGTTRVETRYIQHVSETGNPAVDWYYVAYQWNATNDDTIAVPNGVMNANGTQHDIPPRYQCRNCHENLPPSRILGFGAIQLDYANADTTQLDLDRVISASLLTVNPTGTGSPYYPLPSNHGTEPAALGYLHANCGHCHNPSSSVYLNNGVHMELRETVATLGSLATTRPYVTAVDQPVTINVGTSYPNLVTSGQPDMSAMIFRFESTNPAVHMPQLGSEVMDPDGDATLRAWITSLP